jgi:hypothetical protein
MFRQFTAMVCVFLSVLFVLSCDTGSDNPRNDGSGGDGDTDGDTDSDTDGDTDGDSDADSDTDSDTETGSGTEGCTAMDILFVIDNSGSMLEEQQNLITNFPKFIEVLEEYGTPYRVGVTTTAVNRSYKEEIPIFNIPTPMSTFGEDGVLQGLGKCTGMVDPWIDGPGPDVTSLFSCSALVGTDGSATEMPFAGMEAALEKQSAAGMPNEGFYRKDEDSLLVVVLITDEDDCSVVPGGVTKVPLTGSSSCGGPGIYDPEDMFQFLIDLTGGEGRFVVVGIAGPKACDSPFGNADNAKRVNQLIDLCGEYGVQGDICAGDLWVSLRDALEVMQIACDDIPPPV